MDQRPFVDVVELQGPSEGGVDQGCLVSRPSGAIAEYAGLGAAGPSAHQLFQRPNGIGLDGGQGGTDGVQNDQLRPGHGVWRKVLEAQVVGVLDQPGVNVRRRGPVSCHRHRAPPVGDRPGGCRSSVRPAPGANGE